MTSSAQLFSSVPAKDHLGLFHGAEPDGDKVVRTLGYTKKDVARAARIPLPSVRYDTRMPSELRERLIEWATALNLVAGHFHEMDKTILWFRVPNPQLGGLTPRDMIRLGRFRKLLRFIQTALAENSRG